MIDYAPLVAAWKMIGLPAGVSGTSITAKMTDADKLAAINDWQVAGPIVDIPVQQLLAEIEISTAIFALETFATGQPDGTQPHDSALMAAWLLIGKPGSVVPGALANPNSPLFKTSDPKTFATLKGMLDALLAIELATPNTTGITQTVNDSILAMTVGPTLAWKDANGFIDHNHFNAWDLFNAGLISAAEADAIEAARQ